jgi:hypothetical protein
MHKVLFVSFSCFCIKEGVTYLISYPVMFCLSDCVLEQAVITLEVSYFVGIVFRSCTTFCMFYVYLTLLWAGRCASKKGSPQHRPFLCFLVYIVNTF